MSQSNIERMVEAIVRDEMNYVKMLSLDDLDGYVEGLIRDKIELTFSNQDIVETYEQLGD
jgi:hypothetical protein